MVIAKGEGGEANSLVLMGVLLSLIGVRSGAGTLLIGGVNSFVGGQVWIKTTTLPINTTIGTVFRVKEGDYEDY